MTNQPEENVEEKKIASKLKTRLTTPQILSIGGIALAVAVFITFLVQMRNEVNTTQANEDFVQGELNRVEPAYAKLRQQIEQKGITPVTPSLVTLIGPDGIASEGAPLVVTYTLTGSAAQALGRGGSLRCTDPTGRGQYICVGVTMPTLKASGHSKN